MTDILIRKTNKSVVGRWETSPKRLPHPDKPRGALAVGISNSRPQDFGDYILVTADVSGPVANKDQIQLADVIVVSNDFSVTITKKVRAKTSLEQQETAKVGLREVDNAEHLELIVDTIELLFSELSIDDSKLSGQAQARYRKIKALVDKAK